MGIILGIVTVVSLGALSFSLAALVKDSKKKSRNRTRR